ncbi:superoxide dismutase family protein [Egicoccus halophilus]|uniref:Superoxide dismutase [Cu-Zn] n=1 Tax=Egicoccus halophilus TaxID=1670830 RepID=A0A8J3EW61_9ACTN|nr:superoxide dismutase family protein [Egicoccus halophilus]GGI09638.1 superoxide dismutase [Cu-Zn] [Egicoccus halophilus]
MRSTRRTVAGLLLAPALVLAACEDGESPTADQTDGVEGTADVGDVEGEELSPGEDTGPATTTDDQRVSGEFVDVDGQTVGTVSMSETSDGVLVEAQVDGLDESGWRGFHLHENPTCDPDDPEGPFQGAGGHWAPADTDHGEHPGDFPPLLVNDTGAYVTFLTTAFRFADLPPDGLAVMIHADPDNLGHIPDRYQSDDADEPGPDQATRDTGDGGDRAACAVVAPDGDMDQDAQADADGLDEDEAADDGAADDEDADDVGADADDEGGGEVDDSLGNGEEAED